MCNSIPQNSSNLKKLKILKFHRNFQQRTSDRISAARELMYAVKLATDGVVLQGKSGLFAIETTHAPANSGIFY